MHDLDHLISLLEAEPGSAIRGIAAATGIPYSTLRKLRSRETPNPRYSTVERLRAHYQSDGKQSSWDRPG